MELARTISGDGNHSGTTDMRIVCLLRDFRATSPVPKRNMANSVFVCMPVCRSSVCLLCSYISKTARSNLDYFCARYLWPWIAPTLTTTQYVMCFRFCWWRHMFSRTETCEPQSHARAFLWDWWWTIVTNCPADLFATLLLCRRMQWRQIARRGGGTKSAIHDFFVDYDGLTVPRIPANDINKW